MRKIELELSNEFKDYCPQAELFKAVGRLSVWALDKFDTVKICEDGKTDLIAYYTATTSEAKYIIGAVWRGNEFSFHS